ncbi:MAG: ABC transporter ATP-binding protein [Acidobacteriota bacterium]
MLEVERINFAYGVQQALWGVSLRVNEGEFVALVGSNGAGKTTLMRIISGLSTPTSGQVQFGGRSLVALPTHRICEMGIIHIPEGRKLFPQMTVRENLEIGAYSPALRRRGENLERVFRLFPILKEREKQDAGTLSGGEQQMLAIGRGLMSSPKLLILDEPTLGLAPKLAASLLDTLKLLNDEGITILLVSQEVTHALQLAQRAYVLENGRNVLEGTGIALLQDPQIRAAYLGL